MANIIDKNAFIFKKIFYLSLAFICVNNIINS